ncbi:hypothetical protein NDU88_004524 [Pleurodeles waltl]|uniref:Uncharacterized protein n=1 Tax=Pleurodeles waltl TaxID=8319 RepID=A0AAV7QIL3_PLEWA|nr:hypothetical protein NDU88_004524 [Pleurodeles waltl]
MKFCGGRSPEGCRVLLLVPPDGRAPRRGLALPAALAISLKSGRLQRGACGACAHQSDPRPADCRGGAWRHAATP